MRYNAFMNELLVHINKARNNFHKAKHLRRLHPHQYLNTPASTDFCYIASEYIFHKLGGIYSKFRPKYTYVKNKTHWYLEDDKSTIIDTTWDQFNFDLTSYYKRGKKAGFLTGYTKPSLKTKFFTKICDKYILENPNEVESQYCVFSLNIL